MRLSSIVALAAALAPAAASTIDRRGQSILTGDAIKVPGDSPLELCPNKDHDLDLVTIESVDLSPNPPQAGVNLTITAVGTVYETITENAYVLLQVKYGVIRLITTKADLCEQIKNVDMDCPIEKGLLTITKTVELPNEIPPGKYTVFADVYTWDNKPITCLQATVFFSRGGSKGFFSSLEL